MFPQLQRPNPCLFITTSIIIFYSIVIRYATRGTYLDVWTYKKDSVLVIGCEVEEERELKFHEHIYLHSIFEFSSEYASYRIFRTYPWYLKKSLQCLLRVFTKISYFCAFYSQMLCHQTLRLINIIEKPSCCFGVNDKSKFGWYDPAVQTNTQLIHCVLCYCQSFVLELLGWEATIKLTQSFPLDDRRLTQTSH